MDESSIMRVDESMVSGVEKLKDFFGSTLESKDTQNMLGALNNEPHSSAGTPSVIETGNDPSSSQAKPAESGAGRIKGWKERLDLMRKQKAAQIEESRITANDSQSEQKSKETASDANNTLTDIFAPASGLQRADDGKFQVDKEKVEKKKEIEYQKKDENLV